jgi:nucleoside-triphosphatase
MRLLLTGTPGVGKTTLIRAVVKRLENVKCAGFYTEEKRQEGERIGFRIVTLRGDDGVLASVGRAAPTVGRYSIHVEEFEELVLPELDPGTSPADLYVIDEIGKMELLSSKFRRKVTALLAQPTHVVATVAKKGNGFIQQIKRREDIELIEVTRKNRDQLAGEIAQKIKAELASS